MGLPVCCYSSPTTKLWGSYLLLQPTFKSVSERTKKVYSDIHLLPCQWSVPFVLSYFTQPSFEPMVTSNVRVLSIKILFGGNHLHQTSWQTCSTLVWQTVSAVFQRQSDPFENCRWFPLTGTNSASHLPPSLTSYTQRTMHSLDLRRALAFYLNRTK